LNDGKKRIGGKRWGFVGLGVDDGGLGHGSFL